MIATRAGVCNPLQPPATRAPQPHVSQRDQRTAR